MNKENTKEVREKFISKWTIEVLENLQLEDYIWDSSSDFGKSFTYDLVYNTPGIGSIKGGEPLTQFKIKY